MLRSRLILNRVIVAGIGRTVGYFTYNHDSLDFSCQYQALCACLHAVRKSSSFMLLDVFYDFLIWTSIEPCLGVVGCCLPTLRPLIDSTYSTIYSKIKSTLSRQSLLQNSVTEPRRKRSEKRHAWVELTNETHSQSKLRERYGAIGDGEHLH